MNNGWGKPESNRHVRETHQQSRVRQWIPKMWRLKGTRRCQRLLDDSTGTFGDFSYASIFRSHWGLHQRKVHPGSSMDSAQHSALPVSTKLHYSIEFFRLHTIVHDHSTLRVFNPICLWKLRTPWSGPWLCGELQGTPASQGHCREVCHGTGCSGLTTQNPEFQSSLWPSYKFAQSTDLCGLWLDWIKLFSSGFCKIT